MSQPDITSEVAGATAEALVANANRLGLTWNMRLATVTGKNGEFVNARYDGDTASIGMVTMAGALQAGARAYVLQVPPSGNFIIGSTDITGSWPGATTAYHPNGTISGTTTSSSYANYPGTPILVINKRYGAETQMLFHYAGTMWCNGAVGTQVNVGILVDGTDWDMSFLNFNVAASHMTVAGTRQVDAPIGESTYNLRWKRFGGTGTLTIDAADFAVVSVQEVPID